MKKAIVMISLLLLVLTGCNAGQGKAQASYGTGRNVSNRDSAAW